MRNLMAGMVAAALLVGCSNAPDVSEVPVPSDGAVFNGSYAGTLTEPLRVVGVAASADQGTLYVAAVASQHTLMLELDAATGAERRRVSVAIEEPKALARRADGQLVLAAREGSAVLDPASLGVVSALPAAEYVSRDGGTLLEQHFGSAQAIERFSTLTGAALPTVALSSNDLGLQLGVSGDLNWTLSRGGASAINLTSGVRVSLSTNAQPNPNCQTSPSATASDLLPVAFDAGDQGFVLARYDGMLEGRALDGTLQQSVSLLSGCDTFYPLSALHLVGTRATLLLPANSAHHGVKAVGWTPGQPLQVVHSDDRAEAQAVYFPFAAAGEYLTANSSQAALTLERGGNWSQTASYPTFPFTAQAIASYQSESLYALNGTLTAFGHTYSFSGQGFTNFLPNHGPKVIFTQAVCAENAAPFVAPCPSVNWGATVNDGRSAPSGSTLPNTFFGEMYFPGQYQSSVRQKQAGSLFLLVSGALNTEGRSLTFSLEPE